MNLWVLDQFWVWDRFEMNVYSVCGGKQICWYSVDLWCGLMFGFFVWWNEIVRNKGSVWHQYLTYDQIIFVTISGKWPIVTAKNLSHVQVNERILKEESYHSSQDSDFNHKESDSLSIDLSNFVEENEEECRSKCQIQKEQSTMRFIWSKRESD